MNYRSEQSIQEMLEAINAVLEAGIVQDVDASPFFSIIFDEATDISVLNSWPFVCGT